MNARANWVYIIPSNAKTLYMYFAVTVAASLFSAPRAEWIKIEPPMITNMYAVSVILKDSLKKSVLKCVRFIRLMPAAINS
jgi:hypothetical protein